MNNPITEQLPADLPEDWTIDQFLAPDGPYVGLDEQHGYNYLMAAVNAAQRAAKQLGEALAAAKAADFGAIPAAQKGAASGVAELDASGKVPSAQLPAMNYDPAGSAQAVQTNLTSHINNKSNPHTVTAAQVGAYTKEQTLQAGTANLFGLSESATPNDVLAYLGKYAQHWWRRVPITYQEVQSPESTVKLVDWDDDSGQKRTIFYADSIEINPSNGEISLKNEASFIASYDDYSSIIDVIKNKYIRNAYIEPESIFYIPDGATVSRTSAVGVSIKDSMKVSSAAMPDYNSPEYVQSSSRSAYPDSGIRDGYEYLYLGIPFDNAVVANLGDAEL